MVAVFFLFIAGIVIAFTGGEAIPVGLCLSGVCALIMWRALKKEKQVNIMVNQKHIEIANEQEGIIVLNKRTANNRNVLQVDAIRDYTLTDHPAELVYTSATVGGITTGGFHVNEAYRTESLGAKTGKYNILLRGYQKNTIVKKIRIQSDMIDSAKANPTVSKFLRGTTLTLKHNVAINIPNDVSKAAEKARQSGRFDIAAKLLRPYTNELELTKEECQAVIDWISAETVSGAINIP